MHCTVLLTWCSLQEGKIGRGELEFSAGEEK